MSYNPSHNIPSCGRPPQHPIIFGDLNYTAEQINELLSLIPFKADRAEVPKMEKLSDVNYLGHVADATLLPEQEQPSWALVGNIEAARPYFFYVQDFVPKGYQPGWNDLSQALGTYNLTALNDVYHTKLLYRFGSYEQIDGADVTEQDVQEIIRIINAVQNNKTVSFFYEPDAVTFNYFGTLDCYYNSSKTEFGCYLPTSDGYVIARCNISKPDKWALVLSSCDNEVSNSKNYNSLKSRPAINGVTLSGNHKPAELDLATLTEFNTLKKDVTEVSSDAQQKAEYAVETSDEARSISVSAESKSDTAVATSNEAKRISEIARNAVATLEGLASATAAAETLAGQIVQIEENKQNIASNKEDVDSKLSELGSKLVYKLNNGGEGIGAYWYLAGESVSSNPRSFSTEDRFRYVQQITVRKDDSYILTTVGGSSARAYAFTDKDRNILEVASSEDRELVDKKITAPQDGFLFVNCVKEGYDRFSLTVLSVMDYIERKYNSSLENLESIKDVVVTNNVITKESLTEGAYYNFKNLAVGNTAPSTFNKFSTNPTQWGCIRIQISKGSTIHIAAKGGASGRTYALTDVDRTIILLADEYEDTLESPIKIVAEVDGFLYVNQSPATNDNFKVTVDTNIKIELGNVNNRVSDLEKHKPITNTPIMYNQPIDLKKKNLKILDIGNSYTVDATHYLPQLVEASGIDTSDMCLYIATRGGASFKSWCDIYYDRDSYGYSITKKIGGLVADISGSNTNGYGEKFRNTLSNNEWDLIIIHQVSDYAPYFNTWENDGDSGYLSNLIRIIKKHQPGAAIGFLLTHSYMSSYNKNEEGSSYERWVKIADAVKKLRAMYNIDFVIPYGTAIQNLRETSLNNERDLTSDGTHCADGIADYTASCAYFQALIAPRYNKSIVGNDCRVEVSPSGTYPESAISVTDENAMICQMSAFLANCNWYEVINPENVVI